MDVNSGAVLLEKNSAEMGQPSSLTKLMTAYIAFSELNPGATITCSSAAATQNFPTAANVGYRQGDSYHVSDALTGMLMASAEDCAYSLAEKVSGSMEGFADKMNMYAKDLGLVNTHYVNSMGLYAEGHYSCAYDCALVAARLMREFPSYKQMVSEKTTTLYSSGNSTGHEIKSSHRFIAGNETCAYCYAGKTGGSAHGGDGSWALCTYASHAGLNLVCIIMGAPTLNDCYNDTVTLFDAAFDGFESAEVKKLMNTSADGLGNMFADCQFFDKTDDSSIYLDSNALLTLPKGYQADLLESSISYDVPAHMHTGENVIGSINFKYDGKTCGLCNIIYYSMSGSMSAITFGRLFPSYLINPDRGIPAEKTEIVEVGKNSFLDRVKASTLSLYTTAKTAGAAFGLVLFLLGVLIILLAFPLRVSSKTDGLYHKDNTVEEDDFSSVSEVRHIRNSDDNEMREFHE